MTSHHHSTNVVPYEIVIVLFAWHRRRPVTLAADSGGAAETRASAVLVIIVISPAGELRLPCVQIDCVSRFSWQHMPNGIDNGAQQWLSGISLTIILRILAVTDVLTASSR